MFLQHYASWWISQVLSEALHLVALPGLPGGALLRRKFFHKKNTNAFDPKNAPSIPLLRGFSHDIKPKKHKIARYETNCVAK